MTPLRRHALVWLSRSPRPELAVDASVTDRWHADGRPFVVCRQRGAGDGLSLGFCPAVSGLRPRRIAARARREEIVRMAPPPSLEEVVAAHEETGNFRDRVAAFARLSRAAAGDGLDIRVFGSWMWQTLTGGLHVNGSSDLDVLIDVAGAVEARRAAAFLQRESAGCPFKLDGELSFPGLGEVHWREYLGDEPEILVKSLDAVRMIRREEL